MAGVSFKITGLTFPPIYLTLHSLIILPTYFISKGERMRRYEKMGWGSIMNQMRLKDITKLERKYLPAGPAQVL
jgi:hypothetical protein